MIERGGGRTSGLTDWHLMDVLSMWACLQDHDTQGHWKQVTGWRKICDLAMAHLRRLRDYRRGLAEAWPPETSAAARTYLAELDQLIEKVQRTHDTAAANHDALAAAIRAIDSARPELKDLYEQYATKLAQKRSYEAMVADPKALVGNRTTKPPVTDGDLEQLNGQARGIMTGLSGELQQAQFMLQKPPVARPIPRLEESSRDPYFSSAVPVIPPVIPVPISTTAETLRSPKPQPVAPPLSPAVRPVIGGGPLLGSVGAGPPVSPTQPSPTIAFPAPPANGGLNLGIPPATLPRNGIEGPPIRKNAHGGLGPGSSTNKQPNPSTPKPNPPGIIGGSPGMGIGPTGGNAASRRVNPIGGIIGGGGAGTSPTGGAGSRPGSGRVGNMGGTHGLPPLGGSPSIMNAPGGNSPRPSRKARGDEAGHWDPDHPWETDQGVTPIVRPPEDEGPSDPGPAIGFNR
ncbi:hypothetical protein E1193_09985 [Micromonospora sp. KC606]|uniref:hypothetical protein n=1 Tax=Micromonospora sp. KC606 TaxID=2530379 RepID=UPI0010487FE2|nr:hypothetical protein [Micromonospora sp. KC606]TDC82985.1 hypothetical protein E1193_09985 [Micromonospora sp. KC606]